MVAEQPGRAEAAAAGWSTIHAKRFVVALRGSRQLLQKQAPDKNGQLYCKGEEARLLFKMLKEFNADTTGAVNDNGIPWFQRVRQNTRCWAHEDGDGKDFIVSMIYACTVHNY